jgi:thiamine pyrophosphokinase
MKAIVLADGDVEPRDRLDAAWPGWSDGVSLVVAADGGARHADILGLTLDVWVGDGDSIPDGAIRRLAADGVAIEQARVDKDESDTELAIHAAIERGADDIVILGAFGGSRLDHTLANVGLLALPELAGRDATLLDAAARIRLIRATPGGGAPVRLDVSGRVGDLVSLVPFGPGVEGVTTDGLRYPLADEPLPVGPARGLSNVRIRSDASVTIRSGLLLIVESPTLPG